MSQLPTVRKITPGVQQDWRGRTYQQASWPNSSKTVIVPVEQPPSKPFTYTLEHRWSWSADEGFSVFACKSSCSVCDGTSKVNAKIIPFTEY